MLFTSEQVSHGHPDKICDQISDAVVTDCLRHDRNSRVAVEALIKDNHVTVAGEITGKHEPDVKDLVASVLFSVILGGSPVTQLPAIWVGTVLKNFPMAFFWNMFAAAPFTHLLFGLLFRDRTAA